MPESQSQKLALNNKILFLVILIALLASKSQGFTFCHSVCHDYVQTCFNTTEDTCYVCAQSIYKDKDFTNPFNPCIPKDQRSILYKELNSNSMSLIGYSTSSALPKNCGNLTFSGQYVNSDYLQKNYTNINTEHFQLIVRFNVGYIGSWSTGDNLQLQINDGVSTTYHTWGYSCGAHEHYNASNGTVDLTQNLCSTQGTDCVRIREFTIQHNASWVNLKWSALTTESDSNVQSWGIKDLMIVAKTCHRYCDRCFGQSVNQCLTCAPGFFLRGNTCVEKCPKLAIPSTQQCVDSCPIKYFHNSLNNNCQKCLEGCALCSKATHCLVWQNEAPESNLWFEKMQLWIILMIAGIGIIGLAIWKLVIKKYLKNGNEETNNSNSSQDQKEKPKSSKSSNSGELNQMHMTNQNLTNQLWIEDVDNMNAVKVDIRRRKKRKADFDQTMNNSQMQF